MMLYHEIHPDAARTACSEGLQRQASGAKSNDMSLMTDARLDDARPLYLKQAGVSRQRAIYCYLGNDTEVIDIASGNHVTLDEAKARNGHCLLRVSADPQTCWVSDLDAYDAVQQAIDQHRPPVELAQLFATYWQRLQHLPGYDGTISRPEVLVTDDISPASLTRC
jgi:hypothetical protein